MGSFQDLIGKMLQLDPKKRITAEKALQHPWVKGSAAKNEHMGQAQNKIKEFNAARKMRVSVAMELPPLSSVFKGDNINKCLP